MGIDPAGRSCAFIVPGDWNALTGGYAYDRRIACALEHRGWTVERVSLDGAFPFPDAAALAHADAACGALTDATLAIVDGLAFGAMPQVALRHAARLRWVALVHHPLWLETGLPTTTQAALREGEQRALAVARRVIVTSKHTARDVAAMDVPTARIVVVEPGTERAPLEEPPECGEPPGKHPQGEDPVGPSLLCVATLTPRKGHLVLIEALSGLLDRRWTLHCVGSDLRDPAASAAIRDALRRHRMEGRVRLHGEVDDAMLRRFYGRADAFVLASHHEGYGMAYAEALARGLPVVGTRAGATADTVPPDAGVLVPPADAPALRAALARLLDDHGWRASLTRGARRARLRLPDWETAGDAFAAALTGACA